MTKPKQQRSLVWLLFIPLTVILAYIFRSRPAFYVVDILGKGKGIVALRDIQQGELLIHERPLFTVPAEIRTSPTELMSHHLKQLTQADYHAFFNLSYVNLPHGLDPEVHRNEVALAIFQTNAVSAGSKGVGIFPRMARLNHGCSSAFNAVYYWRESEDALRVHALKPIKKGQEILTTYFDTKKPRSQRREYLAGRYGFTCTCDVCSLPDSQSQLSDQRLSAMTELYGRLAEWPGRKIEGNEAIGIIRQIWNLGEAEGYWSERGRLAADAVWVASAHSDAPSAINWARTAAQWASFEVGHDGDLVAEMKRMIADPTQHKAWGSRTRMIVGGL